MVTEKELLKNIRNYSPQEIADAVRSGVVSLYDLSKETEGAFTPLLKRQVKNILDSPTTENNTSSEESNSTLVASANSQESQTIFVAPSIPVSESAIPVISLNEPVIDDSGNDVAEPNQISDASSSEKKPAMFSRIFSFKGRIRRLEYGLTYLVYVLWNIPVHFMSEDQISEGYAIFYLVTSLPILWIMFAQGAKRCHDRGNSGWYQIIPFYFLWMIFAEGESQTNEYGVCPKTI